MEQSTIVELFFSDTEKAKATQRRFGITDPDTLRKKLATSGGSIVDEWFEPCFKSEGFDLEAKGVNQVISLSEAHELIKEGSRNPG